jgi:hypothetical protein
MCICRKQALIDSITEKKDEKLLEEYKKYRTFFDITGADIDNFNYINWNNKQTNLYNKYLDAIKENRS